MATDYYPNPNKSHLDPISIQFNPLTPQRYFCTSNEFTVFKKQVLQAANTDLFNPIGP